VTAGGTREPIDPVRFIGNRSTGKMGAGVARAALDRGAAVTLIAAAVEVDLPADARVVTVETTAELQAALRREVIDADPWPDALVMAAAVADFRPLQPADEKIHRGVSVTLDLVPTPDLLAEVAGAVGARATSDGSRPPILVGFAAETGGLERAATKLRSKGVDLLVANDVAEPGSGFGTDTNRVVILDRAGAREDLPLLTKREVADRLLDRVARALDARDAAGQTDGMQRATRSSAPAEGRR
jgi:phosphopantothenoylcysteine decarboxylase/phosphopantothenate--cysteine ligase